MVSSFIAFLFGYLITWVIFNFVDEYNNNFITRHVGNFKYLIIFLLTVFMPYTLVFLFAGIIWYCARQAIKTNN